jgi:hypothetical protein
VVEHVGRFQEFYAGALGGTDLLEGEPANVKLANSWIINVGGWPTDDKPGVTLEMTRDRGSVSAFPQHPGG